MAAWSTEWEFKGEFLNVSKVSQFVAPDIPEDQVYFHFCFGSWLSICAHSV